MATPYVFSSARSVDFRVVTMMVADNSLRWLPGVLSFFASAAAAVAAITPYHITLQSKGRTALHMHAQESRQLPDRGRGGRTKRRKEGKAQRREGEKRRKSISASISTTV